VGGGGLVTQDHAAAFGRPRAGEDGGLDLRALLVGAGRLRFRPVVGGARRAAAPAAFLVGTEAFLLAAEPRLLAIGDLNNNVRLEVVRVSFSAVVPNVLTPAGRIK
jgi:hypothetical protein